MLLFAHRGASANAPENTIAAFELALGLGATGLESDVWLTADGVAVLDHDGFADDGIFLIGGRTGAGKSSILDAVCFGLYGNVPRYEGGEKRLRSDHCEPADPTEVVVEFDGAVKYSGPEGREHLIAEKRREDALRRLGYRVVRLLWSDLSNPERVARLLSPLRATA